MTSRAAATRAEPDEVDNADEQLLVQRLADLDTRLRSYGSVLVAFSGGADSAMLLAAARGSLGAEHVVAATAWSPSLPAAERAAAADFCASLGVRQVTPATHELERAGYRANAGDRCGFCKSELLDTLGPVAGELGLHVVATGTNADDAVAGFRPGIAAAAARGAVTPLRDAGLTKAQVRAASRRWGLTTWDKPAAACLSSRIAYGVQVSRERLERVERAETGLRGALVAAGIAVRDLRIRDLGDHARVEVDAAAVGAVSRSAQVRAAVRAAGFETVDVDERGFRSGAMNELLPDPDRWRWPPG
ncbi:ATP-dependent sacrificial sulfur transferase LarE [soil metagenome]